jgi:polyhydroxyalkanoate synthesis regulator phasin
VPEVNAVIESIKRTILSALRAVPLTADEVEAVLDGLERKGDITEEQARKLRSALLGKAGAPEGRETTEKLEGEFARLAELLPVVSRREFRELAERVQRLEARLGGGPAASGAGGAAPDGADDAPAAPDEVPSPPAGE